MAKAKLDPSRRWACKRCGCRNEKGCKIWPQQCYWIAPRLCSACMDPEEAHEFAAKGKTKVWTALDAGLAVLRADQGWQPRRGKWKELDLAKLLGILAGARGRVLIREAILATGGSF